MKPIRVFYSPLSRRFYASRAYRTKQNNEGTSEIVTITGDRFDVTDDIARAIKEYDLEFTPMTPEARDDVDNTTSR